MPASEIMKLFKSGKLHAGRSGKIVRNPKQAKAILLSELRSEGKIPERRKKKPKTAQRKHAR
jgi:Family of unknown function (DUF6496)